MGGLIRPKPSVPAIKKREVKLMKEKLTIKELFETTLNGQDIDVITVHYKSTTEQCDNYESITHKNVIVSDYEIDYDADEGMDYLDIIV